MKIVIYWKKNQRRGGGVTLPEAGDVLEGGRVVKGPLDEGEPLGPVAVHHRGRARRAPVVRGPRHPRPR